jgi:DNA-directed RNA polymerase specialized sigma24 family protein
MSEEQPKLKPKEKPHYVNNRDFSNAVNDYVIAANKAKEKGEPRPVITDYIATCFLRIAEGLSYKSNFIRYTYREEMVMDAVENCLKAIENYDIEKATRTQKPNAFAYFTQISWYAFIRRITKEKKQQDIKFKFIEKGGYEDFIAMSDSEYDVTDHSFVDDLRSRIERVHDHDRMLKEFEKKDKEEQKKDPEGLEMFFGG